MCNILWADPKCDLSHSIAADHRHCFHHICFCRLCVTTTTICIYFCRLWTPQFDQNHNWHRTEDLKAYKTNHILVHILTIAIPPLVEVHMASRHKAHGTIHMASRQITQYKAHVGEAASPPAKICQTHLADSHRWLDDRCNNRVAQASNSLWVLSSERSSSRYHHRRHQLFSFYSKNKCHTNGVTPYWCW